MRLAGGQADRGRARSAYAAVRRGCGPGAHSVRPDSYGEVAELYTPTVYTKGAEVVRMIHTLIGPAAFRAGAELYFDRHDGQAVTCEDFLAAMEKPGASI